MTPLSTMRANVVADLKAAAIPGVLNSVFSSRSRKVWPEETPALLLVYTQETVADDEDTAPVSYKCTTTLVVQIEAQEILEDAPQVEETEEALEIRMDLITEAVVHTLQPVHGIAGPWNGLVEWVRFKGLRPNLSAEGEILRNSRQVIFSIEWRVALPNVPPTAEFLRAGTDLEAPLDANAPAVGANFITDMRAP